MIPISVTEKEESHKEVIVISYLEITEPSKILCTILTTETAYSFLSE